MYLKKLELVGFKSFPNKTAVTFSPGVTAIVGPNGCGKTNILDALRWVLGEQRPTMLRGGKMEQVIFNGTSSLKPLGMAEVTLTVINDRSVLPTEYHEVQITRRLFRSDESEYLLNKVPCRLKDITDLFVDTGMGAHSYSVIQQDMIEAVISDKAEERRFLFEEAAGITKYKQRRKAAMRKLEATETDFLRLNDIYAEVKTRVNSLYRQHKKAERYVALRDQIKTWDLWLADVRRQSLADESRQLRAERDQLSDKRSGQTAELDTVAAQVEGERHTLSECERQLSELGQAIYETSEKAHELEKNITVWRTRKTHAGDLIQRNNSDLVDIKRRLTELEAEQSATKAELERQDNDLAGMMAGVETLQQDQAAVDERLLYARSTRDSNNQKLLELEGRISSGKTEEQSLREQETDYRDQMTHLDQSIATNQEAVAALAESLCEAQTSVDGLIAQRTGLETEQTELRERTEALNRESETIGDRSTELVAAIEAAEARRHLLEEMVVQYEGFESGAVAIMEAPDNWAGLRGTVADTFVPVAGMETALEAALGEMSRYLICQDRASAEAIIRHLREGRHGKVGVLVPLAGGLAPLVKRPEISTLPGVVGWLDAHVDAPDDLRGLKDAIVARTLIIEPEADIETILTHLPYGFTAVTTDGRRYAAHTVAGGSTDNIPLFRRREKIAEEAETITALTQKLDSVRHRRSEIQAELAAVRATSAQVTDQLGETAENLEQAQKALADLRYQEKTLTSEQVRIDSERRQLTERLTRIQQRQYTLGLDFSNLTGEKDQLIASLAETGTKLEDVEIAAQQATEAVNQANLALVEARSRRDQTAAAQRHLEALTSDLQTTHATKQREITEAEQTISEADQSISTMETMLTDLFAEREAKIRDQEVIRERQTELSEALKGKETTLKSLRSERDSLGDQLHQAEMRLAAMESELRGLVDRIQEEYEVDITSQTVTRPETEMSNDEARAFVAECREKLKGFGAVNLLALEEYEEASQREKFLSEQITDLNTAKDDLKSTINRINQTARELFNETMDKVQANFTRLFLELFNGGEASVKLVDANDPLESDIEITARPRGKKLLPITMMSGGERALTAISLLFALYLVKPSPFCILDEIDAPLDDANCRRFLGMIRSFSSQTQFVMITHNKITMEAADNLYGVTMEEPGVSKLVAVRFNESGETLPARSETAEDDDEVPAAVRDRMESTVTTTTSDQDS